MSLKISKLQGTPWHYEQRKRTCNDGSKYCIYNRNICSCTESKFYHLSCVGKNNCEWFESKNGTPKSELVNQYMGNKHIDTKEKESINITKEEKIVMPATHSPKKESKEEKFLRLSKGRIDKIEEAIDNLENLSDRYSYSYTDTQIDKMFSYLEKKLQEAKDKFKNKKSSGGFEW